ncbi:MAG: hypothetical protein ABEJ03_00320 [Candidatus Nanohaloarchaea archaeon]
MIGAINPGFPSERDRNLEKRVLEVGEEFGLDVSDAVGSIEAKYLGGYTNARTSFGGEDISLEFDTASFFHKDEERQERIILHELLHVKQAQNELGRWAAEEFDVSREFASELQDTIWEDVRSIEGEAELLLSSLFPEQESAYPRAMEEKKKSLEAKGLDVDTEITEEVEEMEEEAVQHYRRVQDVEVGDNIYLEEGEIGGIEYRVAVMGEDAAETGARRVQEYLSSLYESYEPSRGSVRSYSAAMDTVNGVGGEKKSYTDANAGCAGGDYGTSLGAAPYEVADDIYGGKSIYDDAAA